MSQFISKVGIRRIGSIVSKFNFFIQNILINPRLDYALIDGLSNQLDNMLKEAMNYLTSGVVFNLILGHELDQKIIEHVAKAFIQFNDLELVFKVKPDQRGFISVNEKWGALTKVAAFTKTIDIIGLERIVFKVEWFNKGQHYRLLEQMRVGSNSTIMFLEDSNLSLDMEQENFRGSLWIRIWILLARITKAIFPHEYLSSLLKLPDTLRFDSVNKTWYISRF